DDARAALLERDVAGDGPRVGGGVRPVRGLRRGQVVREVLRRAGAVRAGDRRDRAGGKGRAVVGGGRRGGPLGGLQVEDLRDRRAAELQARDAGDVEDDRDAVEVDRQVDAAAEVLRLRGLVRVERGVGAREVVGAAEEVGDAAAGALRLVVVDGDAL